MSHAARSSSVSSHASFSTMRCSRSPVLVTARISTRGWSSVAEALLDILRKIALFPEPRSPTMIDRRWSKIASVLGRGTKLSSSSSSLSASSAPNLRSLSRNFGARILCDRMTLLTVAWKSSAVPAELSSTSSTRASGESSSRQTSSSVNCDFEASPDYSRRLMAAAGDRLGGFRSRI